MLPSYPSLDAIEAVLADRAHPGSPYLPDDSSGPEHITYKCSYSPSPCSSFYTFAFTADKWVIASSSEKHDHPLHQAQKRPHSPDTPDILHDQPPPPPPTKQPFANNTLPAIGEIAATTKNQLFHRMTAYVTARNVYMAFSVSYDHKNDIGYRWSCLKPGCRSELQVQWHQDAFLIQVSYDHHDHRGVATSEEQSSPLRQFLLAADPSGSLLHFQTMLEKKGFDPEHVSKLSYIDRNEYLLNQLKLPHNVVDPITAYVTMQNSSASSMQYPEAPNRTSGGHPNGPYHQQHHTPKRQRSEIYDPAIRNTYNPPPPLYTAMPQYSQPIYQPMPSYHAPPPMNLPAHLVPNVSGVHDVAVRGITNVGRDWYRRHFSRFGRLIDITILKNPSQQTYDGLTYLHFAYPENATQALSLHGHYIDGSRLHVEYSKGSSSQYHTKPPSSSEENPPSARIFVGLIPSELTEADLAHLMQPYGKIRDIFLSGGEKRRMAFVSFEEVQAAERAVETGRAQGIWFFDWRLNVKVGSFCGVVRTDGGSLLLCGRRDGLGVAV